MLIVAHPAIATIAPSVRATGLPPNPADELIAISSTNAAAKNLNVVVADATGRMIYPTTTLPAQVDLSRRPAGLYFYWIYSEHDIEKSGKFVVTH